MAAEGVVEPKIRGWQRRRYIRDILNGVLKNVTVIKIGQLLLRLTANTFTGEIAVRIREEMAKMW